MLQFLQSTIYMGTASPASGGGSGDAVWGEITGTLADQTDLADALSAKQDTLVSGTNIKTINDQSLLGSGNITISGSVPNQNTAVGATNPLNFWEGTSAEYESGGGSQTWYNWQSGGLSFNTSTLPTNSYYGNIAFGNEKFIYAARFNGNNNRFMISSDNGATWSDMVFDISSQYSSSLTVGGIAYGNGTWAVSITSNPNRYVAYSNDDGSSWTLVQYPSSLTSNQWESIAFGNNVFVSIATNRETIYSSDGQTWVQGGNLPGSSSNWNRLSFYDSKFFAIAYNSIDAAYSTNGQSWTSITLPESKNWKGIVYGNNKLVICCYGSSDNVYYSDDMGQTWNSATIPFSADTSVALTYNDGIFFAIGKTQAAYSTDAINWTVESLSLSSSSWVLAYGSNTFVYIDANMTKNVGYAIKSVGAECFTIDSAPTTSSQVYSAPNTISTLTITSVGTGTITLSDTNTYNYNASGNQTTSQTVGEAHPDWICFIEGVGVKKGTTTIASIAPTVDQTYSATSTNAQSGVAVASGISDTLGTIETALSEV